MKEGDVSKVDWWETLVSTATGYGTAYSSIPKLMTVNGLSTTALKYAEGDEHFVAEGIMSAGASFVGSGAGKTAKRGIRKVFSPKVGTVVAEDNLIKY